MQVGQGRLDVARQHLKVAKGLKAIVKALFGGYVQQFGRTAKEVRETLQVEPKKAMALEAVGSGRKNLRPNGSAIAVGKKSAVGFAVNGVGVLSAPIE
jgi:hypothetical protein